MSQKSRLTRRQFLKLLASGAIGTGAVSMLPHRQLTGMAGSSSPCGESTTRRGGSNTGSSSEYSGNSPTPSDLLLDVPFEDSGWESELTGNGRYNHSQITADPTGRFDSVLEIQFQKGQEEALSFKHKFAEDGKQEPEEIWAQFDIYIPEDFQYAHAGPGGFKFPGPIGMYSDKSWGAPRPVYDPDGTNGWWACMITDDRHDPPQADYYVYHMDCDCPTGDHMDAFDIPSGKWHTITQHVKMNTPGERDGVLEAWNDSGQRFRREDMRYRAAGQNRIKVEGYWWLWYMGGNWGSPVNQSVYAKNLKIGTSKL